MITYGIAVIITVILFVFMVPLLDVILTAWDRYLKGVFHITRY